MSRGGPGSTTSIVTEPAAASPPVSVAAAVMVWWPAVRVRLNDDPVPSAPSTSDVQVSVAPRSPSSESTAVAAKVIGWSDASR